MQADDHLLTLIGDIYDAAINAAMWPQVLGKSRDFVGGSAATLFWKDTCAKTGGATYQDGGITPFYEQLYFEKYVKIDPGTSGHFFSEIECPVSTTDLVDYNEFLESRFYNEWAKPQGLIDFVSAPLDKTATSVAMFGVFRHERDGMTDVETRRRMRLIVPHIRRATLIGRVIDLKNTEAAMLADLGNSISAGVYLVNAGGRIMHANRAGYTMIAAGDLLTASTGVLTARDPQADLALREVFAASGCGDLAVGTKGIAVPLLARGGERYVAHVLPLTSGVRRRVGTSYTAALFVHKAAVCVPSTPQVIAEIFNLTPSELRVLLGIIEVGGVPETAEALGISQPTVKTHLQRLFIKTGTHRQVDLVKLVASYSNPLLG